MTIGTVSDFTPEKARKLADEVRARVMTGQDPKGQRRATGKP
jgi:hypothetical protein